MVIHNEYLTGSTLSGDLSVNTEVALMGVVREILVTPTTITTQYNLTITNDQSLIVFYSSSIIGNFAEEVALPFRGIYTIAIDSATNDEAFTIGIIAEE